jgi:hypothetical protein
MEEAPERMAILRMLENGKITATEAADLLRALGDGGGRATESEAQRARRTEWMERATARAARRGRQAAETWARHADEVVSRAGELAARAAEQLGENVGKTFATLPDVMERAARAGWGTFGPGFRFEDVVEGTLEGGEEGPAGLDLEGWNGSVVVKLADGPGVRLVLRKTVHAGSEEEAREIAAAVSAEISGRQVVVRRQGGAPAWPGALAIEAQLPRGARWGGVVRTGNGSIQIADVQLHGVRVETSNGRVLVAAARGSDVEVLTSNGAIQAIGLGGRLDLRTSNGGITVVPDAGGGEGEVHAVTSNGSIDVRVPEGLAVDIDAGTSNGRFETTGLGPAAPRAEGTRGLGRVELVWRSPEWESAASRAHLALRTTNGSIRFV